jgi:hypothetical protein
MQMNIPATFGPIYFCGSLEENWNVYGRTDGRTTDNGRQVMAIAHMILRVRWAKKEYLLSWKELFVNIYWFGLSFINLLSLSKIYTEV